MGCRTMGCLGATTLDRLFISADGATYKRQNAGVLFLLPITSRVRLPRQQRQRGRSCAIAHNEAAPLREMLAEATRNTAKPPQA